MRNRFLFLASLSLLLATAPVVAQEEVEQTEPQGPLFFDTVDVFVVNVDVVVQREDGRPAQGLHRDDFEILEDGVPVDISNFLIVQGRQGIWGDGTGEIPEDFDPSTPMPETRGLSLVVFVDNLNMSSQNRNVILENLSEYITTAFDPRDRFMLVALDDRVEVIQGFTNDPELLLGAIEKMRKPSGAYARFETQQRMLLNRLQRATLSPRATGSFGNTNFEASERDAQSLAAEVGVLAEQRLQKVRATIDILGSFTNSLAGMSGRKGILYISDGIPLRAADSMARAWTNKYEDWALRERADLRSELQTLRLMEGSSEYDSTRAFDALVDHASSNRVVFYTIAAASRVVGNRVSAEFNSSTTTSGRGPRSGDVVALEAQSLDTSMMLLAGGTGGLAYTRSFNVGSLLENIVQDFDMFYSLGYSPDHGPDGEFHEIEVRLKRPGFKLRTMSGYREKDPVSKLQDLTMSALHYGLADNRLEVRLEPQVQVAREDGRYLVPILVKIPFRNLLLLPQEDHHASQVSLFVIVRDEKTGGVSPFQRIDLPIKIPNSAMLQALTQVAGYPLELNMKKGPKRIAIGVRDHVANSFATVNLDLDVGKAPD